MIGSHSSLLWDLGTAIHVPLGVEMLTRGSITLQHTRPHTHFRGSNGSPVALSAAPAPLPRPRPLPRPPVDPLPLGLGIPGMESPPSSSSSCSSSPMSGMVRLGSSLATYESERLSTSDSDLISRSGIECSISAYKAETLTGDLQTQMHHTYIMGSASVIIIVHSHTVMLSLQQQLLLQHVSADRVRCATSEKRCFAGHGCLFLFSAACSQAVKDQILNSSSCRQCWPAASVEGPRKATSFCFRFTTALPVARLTEIKH